MGYRISILVTTCLYCVLVELNKTVLLPIPTGRGDPDAGGTPTGFLQNTLTFRRYISTFFVVIAAEIRFTFVRYVIFFLKIWKKSYYCIGKNLEK